jgi:hypothetical protein
MSKRDVGIRGTSTFIGMRTPDEVKEDQNTKRYVETMVNRSAQSPEVDPLGDILVRTTPSLNLEVKPKEETKEPKGFKSQKELENYLVSRPTKAEHKRAYNQGVKEWMEGPGYNHNARSLKDEEKLGKENWLKNQRTIGQLKALKEYHQPKPMKITDYVKKVNDLYSNDPKPVGLGDNYKSDIRTPVQKKRDSYNAKVEANKAKADPTKGAHYIPWQERMAQEEAENLNQIKRSTWEQGGKVRPEPKYVTAQDVKDVYQPKQPEATPLQMKQLHQRLQNHNERTGEFKSTVEKPTHKPRFLHNPVTNELEDTYDPKWGDDILNDKK